MRAIALVLLLAGCSRGMDISPTAVDGGSDDATDPNIENEAGEAGLCPRQCSNDLSSIVDCRGNVIEGCAPDQGCGSNLKCIPACDAAKENGAAMGCEFYAVDPGSDGESAGSCFAAFVTNTWVAPISVAVAYGGKSLDVSQLVRIPVQNGSTIAYQPLPNGQIPPGKVGIVFLADAPSISPGFPVRCPEGVIAYGDDDAASQVTGRIKAFRITTSAPAVAYDIFPYGGAKAYITSASLLLPTHAWGQDYLAIDGYGHGKNSGPLAQPWIEIVGQEDATTVTVRPTADIVGGGGIPFTQAGKSVSYMLDRGEVIQIKQDKELNGTPIQSDKPVGVIGGHGCMIIDEGDFACDSAHQQLPASQQLASEYVAARHRDRSMLVESPPWRIMGVADGTTLTYDPPIPGAPATIQRGQVVLFRSDPDFVVRSQDTAHPFYVGGHMSGVSSYGKNYASGDPEWVNVIPPGQFLKQYTFMTDPTMRNTHLVVVRRASADGTMKEVSLDCAGVLGGWKQVGGDARFQVTRVDLVKDGNKVKACTNGAHAIASEGLFGVTVWGWDWAVSYAYPAGASVRPLNAVTIPIPPN